MVEQESKNQRLQVVQELLQRVLDDPVNLEVPDYDGFVLHMRRVDINRVNANKFEFQRTALERGYEPADFYRVGEGHPEVLQVSYGEHEEDIKFPNYVYIMGEGLVKFDGSDNSDRFSSELWRKRDVPPKVDRESVEE